MTVGGPEAMPVTSSSTGADSNSIAGRWYSSWGQRFRGGEDVSSKGAGLLRCQATSR